MAYPDAGGGGDGLRAPAEVEDADGAGGIEDGDGVQCAGDAEVAGEAAGAADAFDGADEDAAWGAIGFGDEIETLVEAVDQVDVGAAGRAVDDAGTGVSPREAWAALSSRPR